MLTVVTSLFGTRPGPMLRVLAIAALCLLTLVLALSVNTSSIALLFAILTIMLYLLVPWTSLGGVDIGWLVGLIVSGCSYLWLSRSFRAAAETPAILSSQRLLGVASEDAGLR
jgi:hypothetical protein